MRLSGINAANPSCDLEPEFVRITPDSQQAVVTLQENNAMVVVDLASGTLGQPIGLGAKDWSGLSVDTSDDDGGYFPGERDFQSLYMPDGMDVWSEPVAPSSLRAVVFDAIAQRIPMGDQIAI